MALAPLPNLGSQLERAIAAWLSDSGAGTKNDIFVSNDSRDRAGLFETGLTDILAHQSTHDPEFTGNEIWHVTIQHKFGSASQPGQSNPELNRLKIDARVGMQVAALCQTTNGVNFDATVNGITKSGRALKTSADAKISANNQDMGDFTCLLVRFLGSTRGEPENKSCVWIEERRYEITACSSNVD